VKKLAAVKDPDARRITDWWVNTTFNFSDLCGYLGPEEEHMTREVSIYTAMVEMERSFAVQCVYVKQKGSNGVEPNRS